VCILFSRNRLKDHTAGLAMNDKVKWTNLTRQEIADKLGEKYFPVSVTVVDQLLEKQGYRPPQAFKSEARKKNIPDRDEQFNNIALLKEEYHANGNPVMSMDVKKKELIGNFHRRGTLQTLEPVRVNDHDFESLADGFVKPDGLYDLYQNLG